ncbi:MAG: dephospho-CoA kinase [Pseudomonadota bacterium]
MIRIGLTGSIGMGKSTAAQMFAELGAWVWDADMAVHRMYQKDGIAVAPIEEAFPGVVRDGAVDRAALAGIVLGDPANLARLEAIVHPLVAQDRERFMADAAAAGAPAVVLDIPLLFENATQALFDAVVVVSAPADVQRARVLARPGMTEEKFNAILAQQTPDAQKRELADYVVSSDQPLNEMAENVARVYQDIRETRSSTDRDGENGARLN